ncbi:Stb3p LALA0_S03e01750g [Lachancea lanzarotensis]|uniref:LALA0S03e01750g1_1 n=1 Tax=Lachancea lanzarotensis TaxID=1245769 RepID=A0A0C7MV16_9SACH|nr:uncharacterized protein LALA0_S03e01750g [Lachancea lanzarotensis]CEP61388.1 LALA0S03e01750g1_1 [Lachancea lanzarotensis]
MTAGVDKIDLCPKTDLTDGVKLEKELVETAGSNSITTTNNLLVSPAKISELLLSEGPLAIRFITKALCKQMPGFAELSASKQRRLIMAALEMGDRTSCVVFTKIGWGHWSATKVENAADFDKEREATNIANSKIKDLMSQERRKSSSVSQTRKVEAAGAAGLKRELELRGGSRAAMFLDENALAFDDEEYDDNVGDLAGNHDEIDDDNDFHDNGYDFFKKRKSSIVVYAENSPPDELDHEAAALHSSASLRPSLKSHRRSSSKIRSASVSKRSSFRGSNASLEAITRRLSSPANVIDKQNTKVATGSSGPKTAKDAETRGREPRLSFSKESSLRSTLLSHANHKSSPIQRAIDSSQNKDLSYYRLNSPSSGLNGLSSSIGEDDGAAIEEDEDLDRLDDTDEEDWKHIGAESLRNSRATSQIRSPPQVQSPHSLATNRPGLERQPSHLSLSPPTLLGGSESIPKSQSAANLKQEPQAETQDAAFLLMSLKS